MKLGKTVFVLYGCGACNSPQALRILGLDKPSDRWEDWRGQDLETRRARLRREIDLAMGLPPHDLPEPRSDPSPPAPLPRREPFAADAHGDTSDNGDWPKVAQPGDGLPGRWIVR